MARPGVTREQVFEAADALAREGQSPTVMAVRTRIGGGSPNTITPLVAEWKELHEMKHAESLPPLPEPVESAMRQVWGVAWKETQTLLEAERDALNTTRKAIESERGEMLGEIERLDRDFDKAKVENKAGTEALEAERRSHDQTKAEVREAKAISAERDKRNQAQESELQELRRQYHDADGKVKSLEAEQTHITKELERERKLCTEANRKAEQLHDQVVKLQADLKSAQRHAKEAKEITDASGKKVQRLEGDLEKERSAKDKERLAREEANKKAVELRVEVASLTERSVQTQDLKNMVEELQNRLAELAKDQRKTPKKTS